jgi:D-alanyl-D-alanine dipeptidase
MREASQSRHSSATSIDRTDAARLCEQGFVNYSKVWRHFSLPGAGGEAYDLATQPSRNRFLRIP